MDQFDRKVVAGICPGTIASESRDVCVGHFLEQIDDALVVKLNACDFSRAIACTPNKSVIDLLFISEEGSGARYSVHLKIDERRLSMDQCCKDFACANILKHHFLKTMSDELDSILRSAPEMSAKNSCTVTHDDENTVGEHILRFVVAMGHGVGYIWRSILLRRRILVCSESTSKVENLPRIINLMLYHISRSHNQI